MEIHAATGDWMNEYARRSSSRRRDNRVYVPPADLVKRSIRRSWTISNSTPRWSALRSSPELRPYSSLPRQHDYLYSHSDENCSPSQRSSSSSSTPVFIQQSPASSPFTPRDSTVNAYFPANGHKQSSLPDQLEMCPTTPPLVHVRRKQFSEDGGTRPVAWQTLLARGRAKSEEVSHGVLKASGTSIVHISHEPSLPPLDITLPHSEFSPSKRRHISFDVSLGDSGRSSPVPIFQQQRRSLVVGKDGPLSLSSSPQHVASQRFSILGQHSASSSPQQRRALFSQDYVTTTPVEHSGNSDSGGEVVATPPLSSRRFGPSPEPSGSPASARASSGDDFDVEPLSGTVFRKVTVKKRRQETRRVIDNSEALRGGRRTTTRVTESLRVTEVARRVSTTPLFDDADPACCYRVLQPDGDDYKLVFISSDSSSKEEEEEEDEEDSDGDDADTSSTASSAAAGFSLDDCDWDYFEASAEGPRGTLGRPRPPVSCVRSVAACSRSRRTSCEACGALGLGPGLYGVPVPIPVPVPVPIPVPVLWAAPDVDYGDDPSGGVRIRIRSLQRPPAVSQVVLGPWRAPVISTDTRDSAADVGVSVAEEAMPTGGGDTAEDSIVLVSFRPLQEQPQESAVAPPPSTERREWFSDSSTDGDVGRPPPTAAKRPQPPPPQQTQLQSRTCGGRRRRGEDMLPSWGSSSASSDSDSDGSQPLVGEYRFNDSSAAAESSDDEDGHFSEVLVVNDGGSGEDHDVAACAREEDDDGGVTVVLTRVKHLPDSDVGAPDVRLKTAAVIEAEAEHNGHDNVCREVSAPPDDEEGVGSYNVVLKCIRALDGELQRETTHNSAEAQVITTDSDNCDKPTITPPGDDNVDICVKMTASEDGEADVISAESGNEAGVTVAGSDDAKTDLVVVIRENDDPDAIPAACENFEADMAAVHSVDSRENVTAVDSENNKENIGHVCSENNKENIGHVCSENKEYTDVDIKNNKTNIVTVGIDNSQIKIASVDSEDGKVHGAVVCSENSDTDVVVLVSENMKADMIAVDSENIKAFGAAVSNENSSTDVVVLGSENFKTDLTAVSGKNSSTELVVLGSPYFKTDVTAVASENIKAVEAAVSSENSNTDVVVLGSKNINADLTAASSENSSTELVVLGSLNFKTDVTAVGSENINADMIAMGSENIMADVTAVGSENIKTDVTAVGSVNIKADVTAVGSEYSNTDVIVLVSEEVLADVPSNENNSSTDVVVLDNKNSKEVAVVDNENNPVLVHSDSENNLVLVTPGSENNARLITPGSENNTRLLTPGSENNTESVAPCSENNTVLVTLDSEINTVMATSGSENNVIIVTSGNENNTESITPDSENNTVLVTSGSENQTTLLISGKENTSADLVKVGKENSKTNKAAVSSEDCEVDVKTAESEKSKLVMAVTSSGDMADMEIVSSDNMADKEIVSSDDMACMEIVNSDDLAYMEIASSVDMADAKIKSSENVIADTVVVDSDNNINLATVGSENDASGATTVDSDVGKVDVTATEYENGKVFMTTAGSENNTPDVKTADSENNTADVKTADSDNNTADAKTADSENNTADVKTAVSENYTAGVKTAGSENVSAYVVAENGEAGVTTANSENVHLKVIVADSEDEMAEEESTEIGSEDAGDFSLAAGSDVFEQPGSSSARSRRRRSMDDGLLAVARRRRAVSPPGVAARNYDGWPALPAYDVLSPGLVELARGTQAVSCPDIPSAVVSEPGSSSPEVCSESRSEQWRVGPEEQRPQVSAIPGDDIERSKCHDQLVSEDVAGVEPVVTAGCVQTAQESAETVACVQGSVQPASCDVTPGGHVHAAECKSGPCDEESGTESWSDSRRWGDAPKESSDIEEDAARESIGGRAASPVEKGASDGRGYTSLVMITQDVCPKAAAVSVVASDTTTVVPGDVVVSHTNWQHSEKAAGLAGYFTLTLETNSPVPSTRRPLVTRKTPEVISEPVEEQVKVVTGADTLSAVVCLEEGLADDDSWVEEMDDRTNDDEDFATTTPTEDSSSDDGGSLGSYGDREEELRGYHRTAIDFTLFTIVEESCEESEVEQGSDRAKRKQRPVSSSELEKYFFYGLGGGPAVTKDTDSLSDSCSSVYSESMESLRADDANEEEADPAELASSRLEKYFHSEFMMFGAENRESDGSGSVGSDSEGRPSPEQRRKRLVRARNMGRSHGSSLEHLDHSGSEQHSAADTLVESDGSSTETDTHDELVTFDGPFDTVKRKKKKRSSSSSELDRRPTPTEFLEKSAAEDARADEGDLTSDEEGSKTPQPEFLLPADLSASRNKQQSRDSGFVGSCDDLLKEQRSHSDSSSCSNSAEATRKVKPSSDGSPCGSDNERPVRELTTPLPLAVEGESPSPVDDEQASPVSIQTSTPPAVTLTRKDSFNNWSSDEETNLMMSKMRAFFKTMVAAANSGGTPGKGGSSPGPAQRGAKPPQLVYFENELTRLMKTVPGIRDDQVKEIVEYLSSEDTWSDSYDSSDYTSSDLEGAAAYYQHAGRSELQEQISASCQQIIDKFDVSGVREVGESPEHQLPASQPTVSRDTALVYQRLVASFGKMAGGGEQSTSSDANSTPHSSPPLIAKVMHHIGSRLVALMHEVSGGEGGATPGPRPRHPHHHHRRLQQKISSTSTTTEEDDSHTDTESDGKLCLPATYCGLLPRSKSHDVLLEQEMRAHQKESLRSSSSGVSDMAEEREASDCERFSWRGSFESALMVPDSRTKLSLLSGGDGSTSGSALALAAKRRSAGDLLLASSARSCSREQLDRVRSCGSIGGGGVGEERIWGRRRGSVPDASAESGDGDEEDDDDDEDDDEVEDEADDPRSARSTTLPRSLQQTAAVVGGGGGGTNSLPRLPAAPAASSVPSTPHIHKAHSVQHFLQSGNVKSARYRPPGFSRPAAPKRAVSAPGLQPQHPRSRRRPHQLPSALLATDEPSVAEDAPKQPLSPSPMVGGRTSVSGGSVCSSDWPGPEDDIDRLVAIHHTRNSSSSLGPRSDSMASVYSGAGEGRYGTVTVRGEVEFGLQYNYKAGDLEIVVKQCRDLAPVDTKKNRSDPYVKVYLLPDKSKSGKRKTRVKKHTLNPVFDETLKFHMTLNGLETRTLWLTVWHSDMFGHNDFLGEVMMGLENKVFDDPMPKWYPLQERTEPFDDLFSYKGDIIVGLKFVPPDVTVMKKGKRSRGFLHVLVKEAKNLTAVKANGTSDPFCKSYLLSDKARSSKKKTPVVRKTCNPVWNHTFVYDDVSLQELSERSLELTVWDHDLLASNEFLGGLRFNLGTGKHYGKPVDWMDATGNEMTLWQSMLERPNFWVEGCLALRASLDNRTSS